MLGLAAVGLLVVGVAACGSSGGSRRAATTVEVRCRRVARRHRLGAHGDDADRARARGASAVSAKFADGRISGHSGCNTYRTSFTQDGSTLTFGKDIVTTRMACPSGPSAVEQAYLERLPKVASFARAGIDAHAEGRRRRHAARLRAGAERRATRSPATGRSRPSTPATRSRARSGADLTATFTPTRVSGNSGCNTFHGAAKIDGTTITIGPLASTMMACTDAALSTQEQQYLQALEAAKTFEVVGDRLSLFRADGGYAVVFERA